MKALLNTLSVSDLLLMITIGMIAGVLYYLLLWYSLKILPHVKRRGLFLFLSACIRIFMLIFTAVYFANDHAGRFILIIIGFILTRVTCINIIKNQIKNKKDPAPK